jgi:hypothetical protein
MFFQKPGDGFQTNELRRLITQFAQVLGPGNFGEEKGAV